MKFARILFLIALLFSLNTNLLSQNTFEFLRLDISPRAAALGGSFVSNADDPNVVFYNPAGINMLEGIPVSFSYMKHLIDINLASAALSKDYEGFGRFVVGLQYINYGDLVRSDEYGTRNGEFSAQETAVLLGYGNSLDDNFYYGANIKFIYSGIDDRSSTAMGVDVGLQYIIPEQLLNFGFSILNMGSQLSSYYNTKEELPLDIRFGVSKKLEHLPLRIYLSFNKLNQEQESFFQRFKAFSAGGEFNLSRVLRLRIGYDNEKRKELKIGTTAGLAGFHLGLGALISTYNFDYAYSSLGSIGAFHRIGITTAF